MDERYNIARGLKFSERGDSPEHEFGISQAERMEIGVPEPTGFYLHVPWSRLAPKIRQLQTRDLSVTTPGTGTGSLAIGTDVIGVRDSLRPTSLAMKFPIVVLEGLQGAAVLPRISSGVTATAPIGEITALTETDPTFGAASGAPHRLSAWIKCSRQLVFQAVNSPEFDAYLARELTRAINQQIDTQILQSPTQGLLYNPAFAQSSAWVAANGWNQIVAVQAALEQAYIDAENAKWLLSTYSAQNWRMTQRGTTTAFFILEDDFVGNIPCYVSALVGSSSTYQTVLADWSNLVIGFWGNGIDIVYDPYTAASTGEVNITVLCYWNAWVTRPTTFLVAPSTSVAFTS